MSIVDESKTAKPSLILDVNSNFAKKKKIYMSPILT